MKIENNNMRGITLIALIVTIIVLLILAAISITMLTGQNSILNRASEAKNKTGVSQEEETVKLSISDALTQGLGTISTENLQNALRNNGLNGPLTGDGPWTYTGEYKKYNIEKSGSVTSKEQNSASSDKIVKALGDYGVTEDNRLVKLEKEEKNVENASGGWYQLTKGEQVEEVGEVKKTYSYDESYYIINTNNEVFSYGKNRFGQLGIGNENQQTAPVKIDGLTNIEDIYGSYYSVFARTKSGEIYAWGENDIGQLGIGNSTKKSTPVKLSGLANIEEIYTDNFCSVYARTTSGEIYAWGENSSGQLGIGNTQNQSTPVKIDGLTNIERIYNDGSCVYAKNRSGEIYVWGTNYSGRLGTGNNEDQSTPVKIDGLTSIEDIYEGYYCAFARTKSGEIYAWGNNNDGKLGIGNTQNQSTPIKINGLTDIEEIYVGHDCTFARNKSGEIYACGRNSSGQLGIGNTQNQSEFVKVDGLSNVREILYSGYVITNDDRIYLICGSSNYVPELIEEQFSDFMEADESINKFEIKDTFNSTYSYYYTNKNNIYVRIESNPY